MEITPITKEEENTTPAVKDTLVPTVIDKKQEKKLSMKNIETITRFNLQEIVDDKTLTVKEKLIKLEAQALKLINKPDTVTETFQTIIADFGKSHSRWIEFISPVRGRMVKRLSLDEAKAYNFDSIEAHIERRTYLGRKFSKERKDDRTDSVENFLRSKLCQEIVKLLKEEDAEEKTDTAEVVAPEKKKKRKYTKISDDVKANRKKNKKVKTDYVEKIDNRLNEFTLAFHSFTFKVIESLKKMESRVNDLELIIEKFRKDFIEEL
jgi:hypothetical protein